MRSYIIWSTKTNERFQNFKIYTAIHFSMLQPKTACTIFVPLIYKPDRDYIHLITVHLQVQLWLGNPSQPPE